MAGNPTAPTATAAPAAPPICLRNFRLLLLVESSLLPLLLESSFPLIGSTS
jgi:hypothetical protein